MRQETRDFLLSNTSGRESLKSDDSALRAEDISSLIFRDTYESAAMDPWIERQIQPLAIRIMGDQVNEGKLSQKIADSILKPILKQLAKSVPSQTRSFTDYAVEQIVPGSLVLYITPLTAKDDTSQWQIGISNTTPEIAYSNFLSTIQAFETQEDFNTIRSKVGILRDSLKSFLELCEGLTRENVEIEGLWMNPNKQTLQGRLSKFGASHATEIFRKLESEETFVISGYVVALNLDGELVLKLGLNEPSRYKVKASSEWVRERKLRLGDRISIRVLEIKLRDRFAVSETSQYKLVEEITETSLW